MVCVIWWRRADIAFCNVRQAIKLKFCTMSRRLILICVLLLTTTIFRFRTKLRHLTYRFKWRFHSAIIGGSTCANMVGTQKTTLSGCACHPSRGEELFVQNLSMFAKHTHYKMHRPPSTGG